MEHEKMGIIVGASKLGAEKSLLKELISQVRKGDGYVIAADGGIRFFLDESIMPDEWLGDMDSSAEGINAEVICKLGNIKMSSCSPIKDDTDTALALDILVNKMGCSKIHIFGGLGGNRIEHSIANIQSMHHYRKLGIQLIMHSENSKLYVLSDECVRYSSDRIGYISVFALSPQITVDIEGLFYEYHGEMVNTSPLGVSNEFCGREASIAIMDGEALIVETNSNHV